MKISINPWTGVPVGYITVKEASARCNIPPTKLRSYIRKGRVGCDTVTIGSGRRSLLYILEETFPDEVVIKRKRRK